jgi:hypothetical protein
MPSMGGSLGATQKGRLCRSNQQRDKRGLALGLLMLKVRELLAGC